MKIKPFIAMLFSAVVVSATTLTHASLLEKINQHVFKDHDGRVIDYPCSMGGEPLVIYSSVDGRDISSKATLLPVYIKDGFQASPINIPNDEISEALSPANLIIQTINPAAGYVSFDLSRKDGANFYVDTANFPIVDTDSGKEGDLQKYVSVFNVTINNTDDMYARIDIPTYNYNFEESSGLYVYSYVNEIKASIASWNQNSKWTNGVLGRNLSNIPYRFSPMKVEDGGETYYDGFGFWICGSDKEQAHHIIGDKKYYVDKIHK
jgi:hypothetical protein